MPFLDLVRRLAGPGRAEREAQRLSKQLDGRLFMQLCRELRLEAPKDAPLLVMQARLSAQAAEDPAAGCELDCYIKKSTGKNVRFTLSAGAQARVCACLRELREALEAQRQPRWKELRLSVDVPGDKYHADFRY